MSARTAPLEVEHPYVEKRPGVQGGRAVIRGTRFPVSSVVQNYRRGLAVEDILREFPHLSPEQVHDALSYYYDHQSEIEQEIAELDDVGRVMQQYPPTLLPPDHVRREDLP